MKLRPYQQEALDATLEKFKTCNSALCVMATGLGKTVYFAHLAKHFLEKGRIMVIDHREELTFQAEDKLGRICDSSVDIEMGEMRARTGFMKADIVVSTVQTQIAGREQRRMELFPPDEFSLLVIDEAHHAPADSYRALIQHYHQNPDLKVLGVTATPDRHDGLAMGQIFSELAYSYDIADAIEDGWLVPIEQQSVFVKSLDYSQIRTTAGDFNGKDLAEVLEFEENLHAIADPTVQLTGDKKTLVFAASVAQAERLCEIINRHKPGQAQFVCGTTPKEYRRKLFNGYSDGEFQYLVNVGVATEGFDEPGIECVVLARPTKSRALYTQMIGRGTRPLPGLVDDCEEATTRRESIFNSSKRCLVVLDFVGNAGRHKLMTATDILGGEYSDDVVELAKRNAAEKSDKEGKPADIATELQNAEREIAHRARMREEAEARDKIKLRACFSTANVNPFDVLDVDPRKEKAWHKGRPPTMGQINYLTKCGVDYSGLSFEHASQLIDSIIKRRERGECTYKQAKVLQRNGFDSNVSFENARKIIDVVAANNWKPLNEMQRQNLKEQLTAVA
jgi:superfamily II DNA or RNA helicase